METSTITVPPDFINQAATNQASLDLFKSVYEARLNAKNNRIDDLIDLASMHNNKEAVEWLSKRDSTHQSTTPKPIIFNPLTRAILNQDIKQVKYLLYQGHAYDGQEFSHAAIFGNIAIMQLLLNNGYNITPTSTSLACRLSTVTAVKWLHEQGGLLTQACYFGVYMGCNSLDILKYLDENNCTGRDEHWKIAVKKGNTGVIKYLCESNRIPKHRKVMLYAVRSGNLDTVKVLHEYGVPVFAECCSEAIKYSRRDMFTYFANTGVISSSELYTAATSGTYNYNKYLEKYGIPWDSKMVIEMVESS